MTIDYEESIGSFRTRFPPLRIFGISSGFEGQKGREGKRRRNEIKQNEIERESSLAKFVFRAFPLSLSVFI